jgi:hypothetical protein
MGLHMSEWPARRCSADACQQGRRPCPCPEACEQAEPVDAMKRRYINAIVSVALVGLCFAVVAVVAVFA